MVLSSLGFHQIEVVKPREQQRKKVRLKVKHEKNLSSRKVPDLKAQAARKKRVLMANLDPHELTCDICQKSFPAIYKLKIHKLTHSLTYPFMCATCGKGFNNKYKMHAHEKKGTHCKDPSQTDVPKTSPSPKPPKIYPCEHCQETFPFIKDLKQHIQQSHKTTVPIVCIHCNLVFTSQKALVAHLKTVHNDCQSGLKFSCTVCGKKFLKLSSLEDHAARHESVRHFACMYCPKRCAIQQDLDRHLRSHSGETQLSCRLCGREFVHRSTYLAHMRRHQGERPYHCRPCAKSFSCLNTLVKHQASHQRKGDVTRLVKATRGGRSREGGALSYIEACPGADLYLPPSPLYPDQTAPVLPQLPPLPHQLAELGGLGYVGERPQGRPRLAALTRLEEEGEQEDSRDDGFILGLFETSQGAVQTTLDTL